MESDERSRKVGDDDGKGGCEQVIVRVVKDRKEIVFNSSSRVSIRPIKDSELQPENAGGAR
jgi:hypothetical protein